MNERSFITLNERFGVNLQKKLIISFDEFHLSTSFLKGATVVYPCLEIKRKIYFRGCSELPDQTSGNGLIGKSNQQTVPVTHGPT